MKKQKRHEVTHAVAKKKTCNLKYNWRLRSNAAELQELSRKLQKLLTSLQPCMAENRNGVQSNSKQNRDHQLVLAIPRYYLFLHCAIHAIFFQE